MLGMQVQCKAETAETVSSELSRASEIWAASSQQQQQCNTAPAPPPLQSLCLLSWSWAGQQHTAAWNIATSDMNLCAKFNREKCTMTAVATYTPVTCSDITFQLSTELWWEMVILEWNNRANGGGKVLCVESFLDIMWCCGTKLGCGQCGDGETWDLCWERYISRPRCRSYEGVVVTNVGV